MRRLSLLLWLTTSACTLLLRNLSAYPCEETHCSEDGQLLLRCEALDEGVGVQHLIDCEAQGTTCAEALLDSSTGALASVCTLCGDGFLDPDREACDDGNLINGDGCNDDCALEFCGDGVDNNSDTESCDDGNNLDGDGCSARCQLEFCGDALRNNVDEECDDGNLTDGDGCTSLCTLEFCGDGVINNIDEVCDDGNNSNTDACLNSCQSARCGDGFVHAGVEECDDGNTSDTDACQSDCTLP